MNADCSRFILISVILIASMQEHIVPNLLSTQILSVCTHTCTYHCCGFQVQDTLVKKAIEQLITEHSDILNRKIEGTLVYL